MLSRRDSTTTQSFNRTQQSRTKHNPTYLEDKTYSLRDDSSEYGADHRDGSYHLQSDLEADGVMLRWNGYDFDNWPDYEVWSGESDITTHYESGITFDTQGSSSVDENGDWSGTVTENGVTHPVYESVYAGGPTYDGWFEGVPQVTPTKETYDQTIPWGERSRRYKGTVELSGEYTTEAFLADVIGQMPDYPEEWGYGTAARIADRSLNADQDDFSMTKTKYKWTTGPSAPMTLKWYEVFVPDDDPATPDVNERWDIEIVGEHIWTLGSGQNESDEFEMDPSENTRNGYYTLLVQPARLAVAGIGEAGKDVAGSDAAPGKVVLINDRDADGDGIPDYADGYNRNSQVAEDDTSSGALLTAVGISVDFVDPQRAKVKFTYDASDPNAITSTPADPYVLPAAGKIRLWTKGTWTQRNAAPLGAGGDYIVPGVEYRLADIPSYFFGRGFYVEAVRVSDAVADIPIKVEVDPTGSAGFVWSDQLRFTGTKISLVGYAYPKPNDLVPNPIDVNHLVASSVERVKAWHDLYGFTPRSYLRYRARVFDPRNNLQQFILNGSALPMAKGLSTFYETEPFICVHSGERSDEVVPGLRYVFVSTEQATWSYNAEGKFSVAGRLGKTPADFNALCEYVEQASDRLWATFSGTASEWGISVEADVAERLRDQPQWVHSVRVTNEPDATGHRRIISINRTVTPPEINATTEIDFVRLKKVRGRFPTLREGDVWTMSKVEEIYELKNSLTARLDASPGGQRERLLNLAGDPKKLIVSGPGKYAVRKR